MLKIALWHGLCDDDDTGRWVCDDTSAAGVGVGVCVDAGIDTVGDAGDAAGGGCGFAASG